MTLSRRWFLGRAAMTSVSAVSSRALVAITQHSTSAADTPIFRNADPAWPRTWNAAIAVVSSNVHTIPAYPHPVLFEGSSY